MKDQPFSGMTDKQKKKLIGKKIYIKIILDDGTITKPFEAKLIDKK